MRLEGKIGLVTAAGSGWDAPAQSGSRKRVQRSGL